MFCFKAVQGNIFFILTVDEMAMYDVKGLAQTDESTEKYPVTLWSQTALWNFSVYSCV